jgi:hypothetical protein
MTPSPKRSLVKLRNHGKRLAAQGLRPIDVWVPDVRSPVFCVEAHRQSRDVAGSPRASEDRGFIDAISDWAAS